MSAFPGSAGAYVLIFEITAETTLSVGRLGTVTLPAGRYAYIGSAHGPGGLQARLERHLRPSKRPHWHIDALTRHYRADPIMFQAGEQRLECAWVRALLALPGATAPLRGFGSSDCREGCPAHLVRLADAVDQKAVAAALRGDGGGCLAITRSDPGAFGRD